MKHRSIGIFIMLAASLAAIPQASQELRSIRDAVGQRARVELWNAFLALQSPGRPKAAQPAPSAASSTVASCETPRTENPGPAAKAPAAKSDDARREAREQTARAGAAETARIIVDPSDGPRVMTVAFNHSEKAALRGVVGAAQAFAEAHKAGELAMFVAPEEDFQFDADALTRVAPRLEHLRGELVRRGEIAELQRQANHDTARKIELARRDHREAERARGETRRRTQPGAYTKGGAELKPAEFMKVFKLKTNDKAGPVAPVAFNPQPSLHLYVPAPPAATE